MQDTLIDQGVSLMLFGMGTVFVFLTILVFATSLMSKIVGRLAAPEVPKVTTNIPSTPSGSASTSMPSQQQLRAIEKAIAAHRQR
ncbi:OadG family protein [Arenicella xantha]|uniref:Probable oxaloacetate decarboxylase gamma chain n=1 Tax=Arenicella xantha TaxID=644221 RepID=A0A395JHU7_9GAMM|nr:OadG family protein [Arenicella xantha]RBP49707.1 oxaloacetate decarboxylase gamma subunit [Arenicella xantha]